VERIGWDGAAGCRAGIEIRSFEVAPERSGGRAGTPDAAFTERRRTVLSLLENQDAPKDREALAYEVALREHGGAITGEAVEEIDISLHNVDLPALDGSGLLEYDADTGTVVPTR